MKSILIVTLFCLLTGFAQVEKPAADALTSSEMQTWKALIDNEQKSNADLQNALVRALDTPVSQMTSQEVHAAIKDSLQRLTLARTQRETVLSQVRLRLNCKDCDISAEGKLIRTATPDKK